MSSLASRGRSWTVGGQRRYAFQNDVDDVTISGLIIENYNNPAQRGVIDSGGSGWKVIGNEIRFNAGAGINIRGEVISSTATTSITTSRSGCWDVESTLGWSTTRSPSTTPTMLSR